MWKTELEDDMSDVHGTGLVTMTARKQFRYRGQSIRPGDRVTLPAADARQLKQARCLQHVLAKLPPSHYARQPVELVFE